MAGMRLIAIVIPLTFWTVGCSTSMSYRPSEKPQVFKVPKSGAYRLYESRAHAAAWDAVLLKDDPIGFCRDSKGKLLAVAELQRHVLCNRVCYEWALVPDPPRPPPVDFNDVKAVLKEVVRDTIIIAVELPFFVLKAMAQSHTRIV
jgi:hypothetical protein